MSILLVIRIESLTMSLKILNELIWSLDYLSAFFYKISNVPFQTGFSLMELLAVITHISTLFD